ncbi:hypothetical protein BHM03_00047829 [Ensete ventricosum]|nr:hypothetical protein BHM03_00047829 [Ensete ventricosum]
MFFSEPPCLLVAHERYFRRTAAFSEPLKQQISSTRRERKRIRRDLAPSFGRATDGCHRTPILLPIYVLRHPIGPLVTSGGRSVIDDICCFKCSKGW